MIYGIGQAANALIGVFVLPIITRCFTKSEVGTIDLFLVLQSIGMVLSLMSIDTALTFYYWDAKNDGDEQKRYVSTAFYSILVLSSAVFVFLVFGKSIVETVFLRSDYGSLYYVSITVIPFYALFQFFNKLCRIHKKPMLFNVLTLTNIMLYLALTYIFVYEFRFGLTFVFLSRLICYLIVLTIGIVCFRNELFCRLSFNKFAGMFKYGFPLLPILLISWVMSSSSRYFILRYYGNDSVADYAIAMKIAMIVALIMQSFNMAWGPYSMSIKDNPKADEVYSKALTYFIYIASASVLIVQIFTPMLILIFSTKNYLNVVNWISFLTIGICLNSMFNILSTGLSIVKKTYYITIGLSIAALVNIGVNVIFVPIIGPVGSVIANVTGYFTSVLGIYYISREYYKIEYEFSNLLKIISVFMVCYLFHFIFGYFVKDYTSIFIIDCFLFIIYVVVTCRLNVIENEKVIRLLKGVITFKKWSASRTLN